MMAVSKKGNRKVKFKGRQYIWYVNDIKEKLKPIDEKIKKLEIDSSEVVNKEKALKEKYY